jgi:CRP/FNR family cyclic AMP-dependent transcriptional regulator
MQAQIINMFDPTPIFEKIGLEKAATKFEKGQIVFSQGDIADAVYYVQKGSLKVIAFSEKGNQAVVAILEAGQFFGERCLYGNNFQIATVMAMEECLITSVGRQTMISVLQSDSDFAEMFISYLVKRNSQIEEMLIDQLLNSSEMRLARVLLLLANFGKEDGPRSIDGRFSQETLAEMIGSNRSFVSSCMNKFRKLGFIEYNGDIKVHASLANAVIFGGDRIRKGRLKPRIASDP